MTTNASRAPVDLDSLAAGAAPRPGTRPDPLAELARIVGQDDPFRALLDAQGGRPAPRGAAAPRIEPAFEPQPARVPPAPYAPAQGTLSQGGSGLRGSLDPDEAPADAFHRYLAEVEHETAQGTPQEGDFEAGFAPVPAPERPRGRRRLMMVGAALSACVVAAAGVMTLKGSHNPRGADGGPLLVMADKAPLKVAPQDAGGVEIPDQNKQIYERKAKDGQIRIVNREEQPLDVNQVARAAEAAAPPPAPSVATATPPASNALQESLGEPRRVRTVSVRPEAPPFARDGQAGQQAAQEQKSVPAPPAMVLPDAVTGTTSAPAPRPARIAQAAATPAVPAAPAPVAETASTPASRARVPVQRVASATPDSLPEATATTEAPAAQAIAGGGFAVQLAVRPSESEARAAYKQLQERFGANLAGRQPLIRQAEVNGKSIFRIRVGPMAREEANGLCTKLQGAGGQCFVAKN